jgi:hypothetical protein
MLSKLISVFKKPKVQGMLGSIQSQRLIQSGWSGLRPYWHVHTGPITKEVGVGEWQRIVSASNKVYWNFGPIAGAIEEKAMYTVGKSWQPRHVGGNGDKRVREWGDKVEEWLVNQFYPVAYTNGMDFVTGLYLDSVSIDRDGDTFTVYTEAESGYPQFQALPWHTVGSRDNGSPLMEGPYKGLKCYNGVILSNGRPVAFNVYGEDQADKKLDRQISARSVDFLFEPRSPDQVRGFPAITPALLDIRDLTTVQGYMREASKLCASIGLIEHNEMGMADPNDPAFQLMNVEAPRTPTQLVGEELYGGSVRYFRANSGAKMEQLEQVQPTDAQERLMDRLMRNALHGCGMPYEFFWDPTKLGGAAVRQVVSKVNRSVADRQQLLRGVARRRIGYAVSKAIKLGLIEPYPGSDLGGSLKWEFLYPPTITVDSGYANADAREAYKLGMRTLTDILAESGRTVEQMLNEREQEELQIRERMQRSGLPESSFRILTPNGNPPDQPQAPLK